MKSAFVHFLICSLVAGMIIFAGCGGEEGGGDNQAGGGNQALLIGKWILESAPPEGNTGGLLSIEENSTWKYWSYADASQFIEPDLTGTWSVENNVLTAIDSEDGESEPAIFSVTETKLMLDYPGSANDHWEYVRQTEEAASGNTSQINQDSLEAMVNATIKALQESGSPDDLEDIEDSVDYLTNENGASLIASSNSRELDREIRMYSGISEVPVSFECGTISRTISLTQGVSYTFKFTGGAGCVFSSGTMVLNIPVNGNTTVTYNDLANTYCTLDGTAVINTEKTTATITTTYTFESFNSCGHTLEGTYTVTKNSQTGEVMYAYGQSQGCSTVGNYSATVQADLDSDAQGNYHGTASISLGSYGSYTCSINNIYLNSGCGLPTSGTMTLTGSGGRTIEVSFEDTNCGNPVATFTYGNWRHTVDLSALVIN